MGVGLYLDGICNLYSQIVPEPPKYRIHLQNIFFPGSPKTPQVLTWTIFYIYLMQWREIVQAFRLTQYLRNQLFSRRC